MSNLSNLKQLKSKTPKTKEVNPTAKARPLKSPYASWTNGTWKYRLLKSYQVDPHKPYARFFMAVQTPNTFGSWELGDSYTTDIMPSLNWPIPTDVYFDPTVWASEGEFMAWMFGEK